MSDLDRLRITQSRRRLRNLCSRRWILVNLNASTVALIKIWGKSPLFNVYVNEQDVESHGFGMLTVFWLHLFISSSRDRYIGDITWSRGDTEFLFECWNISSSFFLSYLLLLNQKTKSIRVSLNQGTADYGNTLFIRGNTQISRTEFVYDKRARDCKCLLTFVLPFTN